MLDAQSFSLGLYLVSISIRAAWACASIPFASGALPKNNVPLVRGGPVCTAIIRPPRAVHAHASAPSRLHARPRTAVRSGGRARLRRGPTPVEGWRQALLWRYVGAGRTSAHNTRFLSLRARASRLRKHLTAPLRVRHLETSDDHDDERRGLVECSWSSAAGRVPRALGLETEPDPRNPRPRGPQASEHPS